jgi:Ca-activated chloride channel family protein
MSFDNFNWFFVLLLVPFFFFWVYRRKIPDSIQYPHIEEGWILKKTWRQRYHGIPSILMGLGLVCLIAILARPIETIQSFRMQREGIAIQIVVDISSSMSQDADYKDNQKTRMEVAKKVLSSFISGDGEELKGRSNDLVGIITFARYSDVISPLTFSHSALDQMVEDLEPSETPNEDGTAYGDAVALAAARLSKLDEIRGEEMANVKNRIIVLLTDGENNCGLYLPDQATALAKEWGIRVYAISLGEAVSVITETKDGKKIDLKSSENPLERMAAYTGGIFRTAHDYESLKGVYAEIDRLEKSQIKEEDFSYEADSSRVFFLLSLLFLISGLWLKATKFRGVH